MGRALAHARATVARFSDATALALLPADRREEALRAIAEAPPRTLRERIGRRVLSRLARMMIARTIEIDDAVRSASPTVHSQLVILGAGLDGRAWRMPELRDTVVFEVDHPDTQREKRPRSASLERLAREVRFVSVDFARDSLDAALAAAGHDAAAPTTWIWEGVVMYLTPDEIQATLAVVARRSAPGSVLSVAYHTSAPYRFLVAIWVRRVGEPLRSKFTREEMRALLLRHGFSVCRDVSIAEIGASLSADLGAALKRMQHLRLATARKG
jgi:methyltransferase (TIGR00027 family)